MNYNIILIIAVIWFTINLLNIILKSCLSHNYLTICQTIGITVKPLQISFNTNSFNRIIYILSNFRPKLSNQWFAFGTIITLLLVIPSFYIIITTIYNLFIINYSDNNRNAFKAQTLVPVIPGVNLPLNDFFYYFISLAISSIYHELGHALAAVREGVRIHSFGVFIFVIIPGAFVNLSTEQVVSLKTWNQLKIFTAGVWHNVSLALFAIILLLINPLILSPLYSQPEGAVLAHIEPVIHLLQPVIKPFSGASGPNGLRDADLITGVDDCKIIDVSNWKQCLSMIANHPPIGYCVSNDFIDKERSFALNPNKCCEDNNEKSLCFSRNNSNEKMCLPVRQLLDKSSITCNHSKECTQKLDIKFNCVKPIADYNNTKLIIIKRQGKPDVLFWGTPSELFQSIIIIKYKPKMTSLPLLTIHYYETLLRYIISFSLSLAVLNVIPCLYLDGQWIANAFIELVFSSRLSARTKRFISSLIIGIGTVSLSCCVALGLYQLTKS